MKNLSFELSVERALRLIKMCPTYAASPLFLRNLDGRTVFLKNETMRMGLGSFKALGGIYAIARLSGGYQADQHQSPFEFIRENAANKIFVCASAGNHGLAVASGAKLFGAKSRIHLCKTVPDHFLSRVRAFGAQVVNSGSNYEESIQAAIADAKDNGDIHLADGSWPGYTTPPRLVMEGYTVIAEELRGMLEMQSRWPTHVFLQAGVGGMAAAITYIIRTSWLVQPRIIIVEPDKAPCIKASIEAKQIVTVDGAESNMGRLDCKMPSMLAIEILESAADDFISISDEDALDAARELSNAGIPTTPSGAAGYAGVKAFNLPQHSIPLVVVTEGPIH